MFVGLCRWARSPERPAGVEPAQPPWQGDRLAATSWALALCAELSKIESTGWESNPRPRVTRAVSSPLDDQCLSVGPVGIEPTSSGLGDRCIALSATVPLESARRESNPRLGAYKAPALAAELRAKARVGPEGFEPTPTWLKARDAAVTPRPCNWPGVCVCGVLAPSPSPSSLQ